MIRNSDSSLLAGDDVDVPFSICSVSGFNTTAKSLRSFRRVSASRPLMSARVFHAPAVFVLICLSNNGCGLACTIGVIATGVDDLPAHARQANDLKPSNAAFFTTNAFESRDFILTFGCAIFLIN